MPKQSLTYRLLKKFGLNFSEEEYGNISFFELSEEDSGDLLMRYY